MMKSSLTVNGLWSIHYNKFLKEQIMKITKKTLNQLTPEQESVYNSQRTTRRRLDMKYDSITIMTDSDLD